MNTLGSLDADGRVACGRCSSMADSCEGAQGQGQLHLGIFPSEWF